MPVSHSTNTQFEKFSQAGNYNFLLFSEVFFDRLGSWFCGGMVAFYRKLGTGYRDSFTSLFS